MNDAVKPQGCTNLVLRELSRVVTRHYDAYVAPTGLKNSQYSLLSHVVLLRALRPGELAARMKLDASTLTRNLQPLIAAGWVEQGPGETRAAARWWPPRRAAPSAPRRSAPGSRRSWRSTRAWATSAWWRCTA